ncbi:MAG: ATP-binding cassette domain-containing protein [Polyangiales bacterium]
MRIFQPRVAWSPDRLSTVSDDPVHVRLIDIEKSYGEHRVLKGITLDILRKKTNVIVGPSGSGKTVLMRQIVRLEKPDKGQILVDGKDFAAMQGMELEAMRKTFGMVFQMSALFDSMNVFDNVAFALREHTRLSAKEINERVMTRLEALGIAHARHKMPSELSGGMQKRVAVARAMIMQSAVLIYDEPTTGLDPVTTQTVDELISETEEKFDITSIVISHDMGSVFRIADRIHFLNFGEIVFNGTKDEFLKDSHPAVRGFLQAAGFA